MKNWECNACGAKFDEPARKDVEGAVWKVCPVCRDDEIRKTSEDAKPQA